MSNEQGEEGVPSIYPRPPPYWEFFKAENVEQLKRLRGDAGIVEDTVPASNLAEVLTIPEDAAGLQYLIPPAEPEDGIVVTFGAIRRKVPVLPIYENPGDALHSNPPNPAELLRLTRASLVAFLEFFNILAVNPTQDYPVKKWEEIFHIQANIMRALNMYRQWAAREEIIKLMEGWVQRARNELGEVNRLEQTLDELLTGFRNEAESVGTTVNGKIKVEEGASSMQNGHGRNANAEADSTEVTNTWGRIAAATVDG